jgi:nitrilase
MRAIVIQCAPGANKADNIAALSAQIEAAVAGERPAMVSLPEMWSCLGAGRAEKLAQSEALPPPGQTTGAGPAFRFLSDTALRLGITLHGGSIGERDGDTLFNTTLVFGPDGREAGRYRKIHLFDVTTPSGLGYRESSLFGAGTTVATCRIGDPAAPLTLGLSICYDLRFPELFIALRRAGAEVIVVPSAFTVETGRDHWEILLRARAIETQCWVVAAATTGTHYDGAGRARETYGHSLIIDPWGSVHADAGPAVGHAEATIDVAAIARIRAAMPLLAHRRLA